MKYLLSFLIIFLSFYGFQEIDAQPPPFDPWPIGIDSPGDLSDFTEALVDWTPLLDTLQRQSRCPDDSSCGPWTNWKFDTAIAVHPSYPNCPILINYRHRTCLTNSLNIQHEIFGYVIRDDLPGCTGLASYLSSGTSTDQADKMNQLEHDIYGLMAKQRFIELQTFLLGAPPAQQDTLFCGDPQGEHVRISYTKGQCRGFCVGYFTMAEFGSAVSYKTSNCGNDACCRVENSFCIDEVTGQLVHTENVTSSTPQLAECYDYPMTNTECYNELILGGYPNAGLHTLESSWVINCRPTCSLNFLDLGGDQIVEGE